MLRLPEIRPISDLARDARAVIKRARERQEPVIITQRGRDVAVLLPIELYRTIEGRAVHRVPSPRLVHPGDAATFRMEMSAVEPARESSDAEI